MIELQIQIYEQLGGIRIKGNAESKGSSTVLENTYAEKFMPKVYNASAEVEKEMGFDKTIEFQPFHMVRKDGTGRS